MTKAVLQASATIHGICVLLRKVSRQTWSGTRRFCGRPHTKKVFLKAEVREGEQLHVQPPAGWNPKILMDGRRVVWKVRMAMLGLRTSPQDERDPCVFANTELDICVGVHVDDIAGSGTQRVNETFVAGTRGCDMAMRWSVVSDKLQEFLGRSLCRTPQGYKFRVRDTVVEGIWFWSNSRVPTHSVSRKLLNVTPSWTNLDNAVTDSCLEGYFGWIVLTSCFLAVHLSATASDAAPCIVSRVPEGSRS